MTLYNQLKQQIERLKNKRITGEELGSLISNLVSPGTIAKHYLKDSKLAYSITKFNYIDILRIKEIADILTKKLGIMEVSDTWEDFEKLSRKKVEDEKSETDFDKILKGVLKVPKENKKPSD